MLCTYSCLVMFFAFNFAQGGDCVRMKLATVWTAVGACVHFLTLVAMPWEA